MNNPYSILTPEILNAMLKQPMYFVRQQYERGKDIFTTIRCRSYLHIMVMMKQTGKEQRDICVYY